MTTRTDLRQPIVAALRDFDTYSFPEAVRAREDY
jgi:hypothetical protein